MGYGKIILAVFVLALAVFIAGTQQFAHRIRVAAAGAPEQVLEMERRGNLAVVVVTGSAGRIEAGFQLMLDHDASRMLISGTGDGVSKDDILRIAGGNQNRNTLAELLECCVDLGSEATNTKGNANETIAWIRAEAIDQIILVTADFHMPRALVEFRRLMPELAIQPYPVPTGGLGLDEEGNTEWWLSQNRILTVTLEYGKYLASLTGRGRG